MIPSRWIAFRVHYASPAAFEIDRSCLWCHEQENEWPKKPNLAGCFPKIARKAVDFLFSWSYVLMQKATCNQSGTSAAAKCPLILWYTVTKTLVSNCHRKRYQRQQHKHFFTFAQTAVVFWLELSVLDSSAKLMKFASGRAFLLLLADLSFTSMIENVFLFEARSFGILLGEFRQIVASSFMSLISSLASSLLCCTFGPYLFVISSLTSGISRRCSWL